MKRKLGVLLVVLSLLCSLAVPTFALRFTDVPENSWYYREVNEMVDAGYLNGYPDGSFRGDDPVTLAEFLTILARVQGVPCGSQGGHWAGQQIDAALRLGWMSSGDLLVTGVDEYLPRQFAAKILVLALGVEDAPDTIRLPFGDVGQIDAAYYPYVEAAYAAGLFVGDTEGNFSPQGYIVRGAAAVLIYRAEHGGTTPPAPGGTISHEGYTADQVKGHFSNCALGAEYGNGIRVVKKWTQPIYYTYSGTPLSGDTAYLERFMEALNGIYGFPGIYPAADGQSANLTIHFVRDEAEMYALTGYQNVNGLASIWYGTGTYEITRGRVVYTNDIDAGERRSVLIEELYQVMGILNDSYDYPESIIYQFYTDAQWPCTLDWAIMELLYHPDMRCGMNESACMAVIDSLLQ